MFLEWFKYLGFLLRYRPLKFINMMCFTISYSHYFILMGFFKLYLRYDNKISRRINKIWKMLKLYLEAKIDFIVFIKYRWVRTVITSQKLQKIGFAFKLYVNIFRKLDVMKKSRIKNICSPIPTLREKGLSSIWEPIPWQEKTGAITGKNNRLKRTYPVTGYSTCHMIGAKTPFQKDQFQGLSRDWWKQ